MPSITLGRCREASSHRTATRPLPAVHRVAGGIPALGIGVGGLGVPVLYGLPLGHGATIATLPLGVRATVDADALTLTIDEPALVV